MRSILSTSMPWPALAILLAALPARAANHKIEPGPDAQQQAQAALVRARMGDVIEFAAGRFDFTGTLSLDVPGVTLRGAGQDKTILSFKNLRQGTGGEGLSVTAGRFTLEDLAVEDARGDAVKISGADGVVIRRVHVSWTGGASAENGSYGLYPVLCRNVLVEHCLVQGASDAGIYVGQSAEVVVRHNKASRNVAGIEIENCERADVYDNELTDNAGGILVFTLPDLVVKTGRHCRVFDNRVLANNHANFAPAGNIVAAVPAGTGIMVVASDEVEIFDNDFKDNQTVNLSIVGYGATQRPFSDPGFDPYCEAIHVHHNRFSGGGDKPAGDLGYLKLLMKGRLPDILCDSAADPARLVDGQLPAELAFSFHDNGDADFTRLDLESLMKLELPRDLVKLAGLKISKAAAPQDAPRAALAAVSLPELEAVAVAAAEVDWSKFPDDLDGWPLWQGKASGQKPRKGVIPYDLNSALFSDYTVKHRLVRLPKAAAARYAADGRFEFPVGTVISKTFAMPENMADPAGPERLLETRILVYESQALGWIGLPYIWNDEQTEARLQLAGGVVDVNWIDGEGRRQTNDYLVPNANDCKGCHRHEGKVRPIGPQGRHLNRDFDYAHGRENQLAYWSRSGALAGAPPPDKAPRLAAWDDESADLDERARAWLDINCAHCHQPGAAAQNSGLDLLSTQNVPVKFGVNKPPVAAGIGSGGLLYDIVPGKTDESILFFRIASTHPDVMMPELGKRMVHAEAVELIRRWIAEMDGEVAAAKR
ncbi:MAG: parallel beta-helix domain-containing protein [Pirellulales bacterium]